MPEPYMLIKGQHGLPQQSQQLFHPVGLPQDRQVAQKLRRFPSGFLGRGGHDSHLLTWLDRVDRGHELHPIANLRAGKETIITKHKRKQAVFLIGVQCLIPGLGRQDFEPTGFQFFSEKRKLSIIVLDIRIFILLRAPASNVNIDSGCRYPLSCSEAVPSPT